MTNNEYITMVVLWNKQRRFINLKPNENLNTIEKSIMKIYSLQQRNYFDEYQIQYYDQIYKTFIDLYTETIQRFQQFLQELLLPNVPSKDENIWYLRIIPKAIRDTSHDSTVVHAHSYPQQESINMQIDDTTSCSQSTTINMDDSHETVASKIENDDQIIEFNSDNPLNFHFEDNIADHQRKQYESEVGPKITSNSHSSSTGGVLLRASKLNSTNPYPILKFQIPTNKLKSSWSLYLYILTECDVNGNYYLHASKGIYDNKTMIEDRFGPIPNSNLVNPYKIQLSEDDIQQGKYEIRLRVCNIRNLSTHKHEQLRKFPELNYFMIYDDDKLKSKFTTTNLNFHSEKYHLGCILVCDYIVQDRCISNITIDDMKRKRK